MLNPARAKSCTVESCSDPFGRPSFSIVSLVAGAPRPAPAAPLAGPLRPAPLRGSLCSYLWQISEEACPLACVTHIAVAQTRDLQQQRIQVAIDQNALDRQLVPRRLAFGPQSSARAAEERGEACF